MKYKLDKEEMEIEKNAGSFRPIRGAEKKEIERALRKIARRSPVTMRINDEDLKKIKEKASEEGMPYQTLISSVLHKYAAGRLYDKNEIQRNIK